VNGNTLEIDPSAYNALQAGALETLRYRYDILDGNGAEVRQVAIINIQGLNDAPTALNDLFTTAEDNAVSGDVLADNGVNPDRDPDGDTLTVSATPVTDVANGTLVLDTDGTFTYTPDADFRFIQCHPGDAVAVNFDLNLIFRPTHLDGTPVIMTQQ